MTISHLPQPVCTHSIGVYYLAHVVGPLVCVCVCVCKQAVTGNGCCCQRVVSCSKKTNNVFMGKVKVNTNFCTFLGGGVCII